MVQDRWLTTFQARNGIQLRVRHLEYDDAPYLVDLFAHMGPDSRYRRFLQSLDNPSPTRVWQEAERIAHAVRPYNDGLIAFADLPGEPNAPVGVARYMQMEPGVAEVAMSVRDDMQGQGVGTYLFRLLVEEARKNGVRKLVGTVQNNNKAMWIVFDRIPYPLTRQLTGTESEVEIDLTARKE
ncbi:MAG TPA: GNAT family N-acetyltransferase [Anaerolineae bacterium]|nr:GNAT family N-acetyltransferase [Anaerolineae bacterium]HIP72084.1 GNAT family N-acetyltransferase [Anaerolineae bacterium]